MNRNVLVTGVSVLIIASVAVGFLLSRGEKGEKAPPTAAPTPPPSIELLGESALAVTLTPGLARQYVLTIDKIPTGTTAVSYEITYDTKSKGTQGIVGSPVTLKPGQTKYANDKIIFGTCSRNKCVYDEGVSNLEINIRIVFSDGSEKGWQGSLEI